MSRGQPVRGLGTREGGEALERISSGKKVSRIERDGRRSFGSMVHALAAGIRLASEVVFAFCQNHYPIGLLLYHPSETIDPSERASERTRLL